MWIIDHLYIELGYIEYIFYTVQADMTSVLEFCVRHTKLAQSQFIDRWMAGLKDFNGAFHIYQTCLAHISQAKKMSFHPICWSEKYIENTL